MVEFSTAVHLVKLLSPGTGTVTATTLSAGGKIVHWSPHIMSSLSYSMSFSQLNTPQDLPFRTSQILQLAPELFAPLVSSTPKISSQLAAHMPLLRDPSLPLWSTFVPLSSQNASQCTAGYAFKQASTVCLHCRLAPC